MQHDLALGIAICLFFVALIVVYCAFLIRLYFRKIRKYTAQLYQKDLDFQKTLTTTVIETQEQVLQNISQDLHDDAGQQLTYLNFQLEHLKLDAPALVPTLDPISKAIAELSDSIRGISHSLSHQLITGQDLFGAMEKEIERLNRQKSVRFTFTASRQSNGTLPPGHQIVIYRIFQESIQNILKHARASEVTVTLEMAPFRLTIRDDGKGFNPALTSNGGTLGLQNMHARAALVDCRLSIETAPGQGTLIELNAIKT